MELKDKINPVKVEKDMKISELIKELSGAGFGAGRLSKACNIVLDMVKDEDCKVFLGLAGAMVPAGMKVLIIDMVKNGWLDVLVSTGANLTHDLVEALGYHHYKGSRYVCDKKLNEKGIDRIYDVYMPNKVYEGLEEFFNEHFDDLKDCETVKEFLWKVGSFLPEDSESILRVCYDSKIPIFCPALSDSGIGLMIWNHLVKGKKTKVNEFEDLKEIIDISWTSKKNGIIYVGGGVPKNYIQQAMQFSKGASYGIQITMDRVETGGSSGAELKEGISWGKMEEEGKFVDLICDATIALPLIVGFVKDGV